MFRFAQCLLLVAISMSTAVFAAGNHLFYQITSPAGVVSYVFGTMHTDDNRVTDFSPKIIDAIKQTDTFMMEVAETRDTSVMQAADKNWSAQLSEAEMDKLKSLVDFHVMHLEPTLQMKPWLLAFMFSSPKPHTPYAQDNLLKTKADELYKNIVGIESAQAHFGVLDSLPMDEKLQLLRASLNRSDEQKEADFERLIAAYLAGDGERILALDETMTSRDLPKSLWANIKKRLLDDRNAVMATRTIKAAKEKPVFIAVGAAHLVGETGLINAYQQAGFTLKPIAF